MNGKDFKTCDGAAFMHRGFQSANGRSTMRCYQKINDDNAENRSRKDTVQEEHGTDCRTMLVIR